MMERLWLWLLRAAGLSRRRPGEPKGLDRL